MLPLRRTLTTLLMSVVFPASVIAQTLSPDVASLRGLAKVRLFVTPMRSDLAAAVDTIGLRTKIELKLREHGIQVDGPGDVGTLGDAAIIVDVGSVHSGALWALDVEVSVHQTATITRNNFVDRDAITWRGGQTSLVGDYYVAGAVLSAASDAIDDFLNVWLQVNPPSR